MPRLMDSQPWIIATLAVTTGFIVLNQLAGADLVYSGEVRALIFAASTILGIWVIDQRNNDTFTRHTPTALALVIVAYATTQAIAIWGFNRTFGTLTNPHYLSLGSSILLIAAIALLPAANAIWRVLLSGSVLLLGYLILLSSSRPIWFGLVCTIVLLIFFLRWRQRIALSVALIVSTTLLLASNIHGVSDRVTNLIDNIDAEERVAIWQDTWQMQRESSPSQWLTGHGLKSFEADFKNYYRYHGTHGSFNSPHNHLLESLYVSGLIGCALFISVMVGVYWQLFHGSRNRTGLRKVYLTLLGIFTANSLSAWLIVPLYSRYSLTVIAVTVGALVVLKRLAGSSTP